MTSTSAQGRSPFLAFESFTPNEAETPMGFTRASATAIRSPFVSLYEAGDDEASYGEPLREAYASLVHELYDEELDEALFELESHARALHHEQLARGTSRREAERLLAQYIAPLARECEAAVSSLASDLTSRESAGLLDEEIDTALHDYVPSAQLSPELEHFLGSLVGKIGKVAKAAVGKAWQGVKQVGLGPILNKLKALVRPLLDRVLQKAIGALPSLVQPAARKLAQKLGFAAPAPTAARAANPQDTNAGAGLSTDGVDAATQHAAGEGDITPQQELDEQIAEAFLAQDEAELELELAQASNTARAAARPVFAQLEDARERFINELESLKHGQSAQPHVEEFLPAVLPALRLGIRLIGRPRVVKFLSPLVAKLITSLIGPQHAPALSNAIVDAGLKLMQLEVDERPSALAASAVAATVEETIGRIAALPDYVLDQQELLEGFALQAFEQAAAANLPAVFPEATYRQRPDLLEGGINAGWVMLPLRGPKRYKKCSRVFNVRVTPHVAHEVEGFEGATLSDYLSDELGLDEAASVDAEVHLYETLPGTQLSDIARAERDERGGLSSDETFPSSLHPLTRKAAAVLLGHPQLGRDLSPTTHSRSLAVGQRLFRLALPHARALASSAFSSRARKPRPLHLTVHMDAVKDEIRVCVFLSEVKAQKLAVRLRQGENQGRLASAFERTIKARLSRIFAGDASSRLHWVHAAMRPGSSMAALLQNLPQASAQLVASKLASWLVQGFVELIQNQSARVVAATEDAADGLTLSFSIPQPPGLKELSLALLERGTGPSTLLKAFASEQRPALNVDVFAGHRCA